MTPIEYNIKSIKIGKSHIKYIPEFKDENKLLLADFLSSEVPMFSKRIMDCIQAVLSGEADCRTFSGNSCELIVNKNDSIIRGNIDGMEVGPECIIKTEELMDLIIHWLADINFLKKK